MRSLFEDFFAFLLRDTSQNRERFTPAVFFLELLEPMEDFLLGFIADAARVIDNQLGLLGRFHLRVALAEKCPDHLFGVMNIHLTSEGFDVERLHFPSL